MISFFLYPSRFLSLVKLVVKIHTFMTNQKLGHNLVIYTFLLPTIIFFALFHYYPLLDTFFKSFYHESRFSTDTPSEPSLSEPLDPNQKKEIRFFLMYNDDMAGYYKEIEAEYERLNPNIDIVIERFPSSSIKDYLTKLNLRFEAKKAPDCIGSIEVQFAMELARQNKLVSAPQKIVSFIEGNTISEKILPYLRNRDSYFAVSNAGVIKGLYYNKDLFRKAGLDPAKPPKTWKELAEYAQKLTKFDSHGKVDVAGLSIRKGSPYFGMTQKWLAFLYGNGGREFNTNFTKSFVNSQQGVEALQFYVDSFYKWRIDSYEHKGDAQGFSQGKVGMFIRGPWVIDYMRKNAPKIDYGIAPLPYSKEPVTIAGFYGICVSRDSKYPYDAWDFIYWLMQDTQYEKFCAKTDLLPMTRSMISKPRYANDPNYSVLISQKDIFIPITAIPNTERIQDALGRHLESACNRMQSAKEALDKAAAEINEILKKSEPKENVFVGLGNYKALSHDHLFIKAVVNTIIYAVFAVTLTIAVSLFFAMVFNSAMRSANLYRTIYFIPVVTSLIAVCMIWRWLYDQDGIINYMFTSVGIPTHNWLKEPAWALPAIVIMNVWKNFGFYMLIFAAGLRAIPQVYYEAASVDGATKWQQFWRITVPQLRPILLFVFVTSVIGAFQVFAQIFSMTLGGPQDSTRTLVYHIYEEGFNFGDMGKAYAASIVLLLIVGVITVFQMTALRKKW